MWSKTVNLENAPILVTGAAGFIGSNLVMERSQELEIVRFCN